MSIEGSGVAKTAILQLLADSAAIDLQRWSPLWYDVRSKGWRDVEEIGHWRPRGDGALDVRMVDRSAPSGCTPEGQLPVVGVGAAASDLGEEVRRGADAGGRSTAGAQGTVTAEHEDSGYFGIGVVGLKTEVWTMNIRQSIHPSHLYSLVFVLKSQCVRGPGQSRHAVAICVATGGCIHFHCWG